MNELYFKNVTKTDNLYLDFILYEFENEPILFICKDKNENLYLCLCSEIRYEQKWLIVPCGLSTLEKLVDQKIDIATAFLNYPQLIIIKMDLNGNESSFMISTDCVDRLDLPEEGTFLQYNLDALQEYISKNSIDPSIIEDTVQFHISTIYTNSKSHKITKNAFEYINTKMCDELHKKRASLQENYYIYAS